jgi:hypothetical protein
VPARAPQCGRRQRTHCKARCKKRHFLLHLYIKRTFYQDRLGTNIGKPLKKEWRFSQIGSLATVRKDILFRAFLKKKNQKPEHLPRQARDDHRETPNKTTVVSISAGTRVPSTFTDASGGLASILCRPRAAAAARKKLGPEFWRASSPEVARALISMIHDLVLPRSSSSSSSSSRSGAAAVNLGRCAQLVRLLLRCGDKTTRWESIDAVATLLQVRKTPLFLSHLYIKTIILPRQARDRHRES